METPLDVTIQAMSPVLTPAASEPRTGSIADAFSSASVLRSSEELVAQILADRAEWGDR